MSGWPPTYHHGAQPAKRMRLLRCHAFVFVRSRSPPKGRARITRAVAYPTTDQNALVKPLVSRQREELGEVVGKRDLVEE